MAKPRKIVMIFEPDGTVKMDASGFEGSACEAEIRAAHEAIGEMTKETKKPEYFQKELNKKKQSN